MSKKKIAKSKKSTKSKANARDAAGEDPAAVAPTFEEAIQRLGNAVRQLEDGNLSLEESLSCYEDGIRYLSQCQNILETAERKIEVLSGFDAAGNPVVEDFEDESLSLDEKAATRSRRRTSRPDASHQPG